MQQVVVKIKDDSKLALFLRFIEHLDFVEVKKTQTTKRTEKQNSSLRNLFGIWKERDVELSDIRNRAWNRN
ncbi:hypothetical protein KAH37_07390 [bacterium]|nr:hypothetical protein [bacterium]